MSIMAAELDRATLERAARESLERPSNSLMWDDRLYSTHGVTFSWAERGSDILTESNYLTALELIKGAAGDDADEHVIDATISDWLVGSLRQIFVQVYDESGDFTPAFREATALALSLRDYPILDESDYNEREYAAWQEAVEQALDDVRREFPDDSQQDEEAIFALCEQDIWDRHGCDGEGSICWDFVAEKYRAARDAYFTKRADEYAMTWVRPVEIPGQLSLL